MREVCGAVILVCLRVQDPLCFSTLTEGRLERRFGSTRLMLKEKDMLAREGVKHRGDEFCEANVQENLQQAAKRAHAAAQRLLLLCTPGLRAQELQSIYEGFCGSGMGSCGDEDPDDMQDQRQSSTTSRRRRVSRTSMRRCRMACERRSTIRTRTWMRSVQLARRRRSGRTLQAEPWCLRPRVLALSCLSLWSASRTTLTLSRLRRAYLDCNDISCVFARPALARSAALSRADHSRPWPVRDAGGRATAWIDSSDGGIYCEGMASLLSRHYMPFQGSTEGSLATLHIHARKLATVPVCRTSWDRCWRRAAARRRTVPSPAC